VPNQAFVNQDGGAVDFNSIRGNRAMAVTFIYTKCPLPDFCPLLVQHLEAVRRRANDDGLGSRLSLVGVTLDPAFDTPAALRAYGESMLSGSNRFEQWTLATGTAAQIEDVAWFFGIGYRAEGGLVTHTLATAVLDAEGRVVRVFESNSWRPDDVYDLVRRTIERTVR